MKITEHTLIRPKEYSEIVVMTKALVDALIEMDTHNRNKKPTVVKAYTEAMKEGKWFCHNQGIGVTRDGFVLDGGHRLDGMRGANYPRIKMNLVLGIDPQAQPYVDQHAKRSMADIFKLFFEKPDLNTKVVTACNVIVKSKNNWFGRVIADDAMAVYEKYASSFELIQSRMNFKQCPVSAPVLAGIVTCVTDVNYRLVLDFMEKLETGAMLECDDPVLLLRNWLIKIKNGTSGGSQLQQERFLKTRRSVKAHLSGEKFTRLYAEKTK